MPTRSRLRRLAAYVLLAWLLGLAAGIANACVVRGEVRHGTPVVSQAAMSDEAMAHDHAGHDHQADHGKPPCERLCDAPAAARPADKELGSALAGFWLAPAPLPSTALRLLPDTADRAPAAHVPWRAAVPLPIAFARLTL